ncbi:MAG: hypothetical protein QNL80_06090 [Akkermansiaceae bacterium]
MIADITVYSEYQLGEDGLIDPPQDLSVNERNYGRVAGANAVVVKDETPPAPVSSAFIQTDVNHGWFQGPFGDLATDNFAFGIYVRASEIAGSVGHIFVTGLDTNAVRIVFAYDDPAAEIPVLGWRADFQAEVVEGAGGGPRDIAVGTQIGDFIPLLPDTWVHLAVVRKDGETGFYADGVLQGATDSVTVPVHSNLSHLAVTSGGQLYFDGGIDELRTITFTSEETIADIITALQGIDTDGDGLYDSFEQRIIDADPADNIATLADVLPGDDFDEDLFTNLKEQSLTTDPTNAADPGSATIDTDEDGLYDIYEQAIIDADPSDGFATFADVLPGDDFDADLYTNFEEQEALYDPVDPLNPSIVSVDLQLLGYWDFNDANEGATTTEDQIGNYIGTLENGVDDVGGISNTVFTADGGGRTGEASDYAIDFGTTTGSGRTVAVTDVNFLAAVNESTANDRLTVSFWQKNSALGAASSFAFNSASQVRAMHGHIPWAANNRIYFDHETSTVGRDRYTSPARVDIPWTTQWNHVVLVKGRRTKQLWVNGERIGNQVPATDGMAEMISLAIGSPVDSLQGQIDDFAVYNDALTDAQIALLAGGASPESIVPPPAGPEITSVTENGNMVTLTWNSKATDIYTIKFSLDLVDWEADVEDGINGEAGSTSQTFDVSDLGLDSIEKLFFRIERE